jgi:hypothetical protein
VTWGTDNAAPFQAAINACPPPFAPVAVNPLSPFTSKGCVIVVPNPGSFGTGDYMFGSGVTLPSQVSFQLIGMGNASMGQESPLAGIRFVTAMPITILTVGNLNTGGATYGVQNYGGFTLQAISFVDTSFVGAAIGGLLMNGVSEAVIERCSFENFNGQQTGLAASTTSLSYGIKATAYGSTFTSALFNNNIVLLHPKGYNNSIFYDASQGAQDGPILMSGDIFVKNTVKAKPTNPPWSGANTGAGCYGVISSGGVRIYGTHFDVEQDSGGTACIGVLTLSAGIISGKFESASSPGKSVVLGGGGQTSTLNVSSGNLVKASNGAVTASSVTNTLTPGQVVNVALGNSTDAANYNGNFVVTSSTASQFTYDYPPGPAPSSTSSASVTPKVSSSVKLDSFFNGMATDVVIDTNASNNLIFDLSSNSTNRVTDLSGVANFYQVSSTSGATSLASLLRSGATSGSTDSMTITDSITATPRTGHLLTVQTAGGSAVMPVLFANNGSGVQMDISGNLGPVGGARIIANNMLVFYCNGTFAINTLSWLFPSGNSVTCSIAGGTEIPVPVTGVLKNLFVKVGIASTIAGDGTVTVYVGGSPTSLKCTLGTATSCSDVADSPNVSAGTSSISVRVQTASSGSEAMTQMRVSLQIQ